ncbi:MAG: thermonuclease family protein [Myxococcota bacterium]
MSGDETASKWAHICLAIGLSTPLSCGSSEVRDLDEAGGADAGAVGFTLAAEVDRIIDGDTIVVRAAPGVETPDGVRLDGESVRLLGVDTPELRTPDGPECFAVEAQRFAIAEIESVRIELEFDETRCRPPEDVAACRGDFDRLLAYVRYVNAEGQSDVFNEALLRTGHADVLPGSRFAHRDSVRYEALAQDAAGAGLGLWACP